MLTFPGFKSQNTLLLPTRTHCVTLRPGVRLNVRFLRVVSVLGLLLLPPATQIRGKRVFGMTEGIDDV